MRSTLTAVFSLAIAVTALSGCAAETSDTQPSATADASVTVAPAPSAETIPLPRDSEMPEVTRETPMPTVDPDAFWTQIDMLWRLDPSGDVMPTPDEALTLGADACAQIAAGTPADEVRVVHRRGEHAQWNDEVVVEAAVLYLCPAS